MKKFYIFIMRTIIGAAFGILLIRAFYPDKNIFYAAGLGVFMVMLAYLFEYMRMNRKKTD
ncbi:MAG: hypothetical protein JRJ49_05220 [Deltaproteobacteria bacterium]|nr:hypothetical protein [Deltaproteobacteria bacterium]